MTKLGKELGQEKTKEHKNVGLINGIIMEYQKVKEEIYGLISELITTSHEFNTALELMGESAFIGEAAAKVVEDHMVNPKEIHLKHKNKREVQINALEEEVSITREDKVVVRVDSRGSSRNSNPAIKQKPWTIYLYIFHGPWPPK